MQLQLQITEENKWERNPKFEKKKMKWNGRARLQHRRRMAPQKEYNVGRPSKSSESTIAAKKDASLSSHPWKEGDFKSTALAQLPAAESCHLTKPRKKCGSNEAATTFILWWSSSILGESSWGFHLLTCFFPLIYSSHLRIIQHTFSSLSFNQKEPTCLEPPPIGNVMFYLFHFLSFSSSSSVMLSSFLIFLHNPTSLFSSFPLLSSCNVL